MEAAAHKRNRSFFPSGHVTFISMIKSNYNIRNKLKYTLSILEIWYWIPFLNIFNLYSLFWEMNILDNFRIVNSLA